LSWLGGVSLGLIPSPASEAASGVLFKVKIQSQTVQNGLSRSENPEGGGFRAKSWMARRGRIHFMGLRLRSNETSQRFAGNPSGRLGMPCARQKRTRPDTTPASKNIFKLLGWGTTPNTNSIVGNIFYACHQCWVHGVPRFSVLSSKLATGFGLVKRREPAQTGSIHEITGS
jgi:hypothetical protein